MALVPIFTARITPDHRLVDVDREALGEFLACCDPGPVRFYMVPVEPLHSPQARGYYRGVVLEIFSEYTGYTKGELHEELKWWYDSGESTAQLTKKQYGTFLECVCALAAMFEVVIPEPNTVYWE